VVPAKADAIATETTVSAAGAPQGNGGSGIKADTVVVYPGGVAGTDIRGQGQGYFTWDLKPGSSMVEGVVRDAKSGPDGRVLQVYYPQAGGTVVIPPDATVVALEPADASLLKPDAQVFVPIANRKTDGTLTSDLIAVGKNGLTPPM
jgi:hypothetical protein